MLRPLPGIKASAIRRRPANCPTSPLAATVIRRSCCLVGPTTCRRTPTPSSTPTLIGSQRAPANAGKRFRWPPPAGTRSRARCSPTREGLHIAHQVQQHTAPEQMPARRRQAKHPNVGTRKRADLQSENGFDRDLQYLTHDTLLQISNVQIIYLMLDIVTAISLSRIVGARRKLCSSSAQATSKDRQAVFTDVMGSAVW